MYMIYDGDYILYSGLVVVLTPFILIIIGYFLRNILRSLRIRKNAKLKNKLEFTYFRGDLDKVNPGIIMFTSMMDIDYKMLISATILKLKLDGYIKEKGKSFIIVEDKDTANLSKSELMVLKLIKNQNFNKKEYIASIKEETFKNKYLTNKKGGKLFKLFKMSLAIIIPIILFIISLFLDDYMFENYHIYPENDNKAYIVLNKESDIEKLYKEVTDLNDYYHRTLANGETYYNYNEIRADKLKYSVVRKSLYLTFLTTFLIGFFIVFVFISIYILITQIIYFNKKYERTIKGNKLLNKAYALRNYLNDFSRMKYKEEKDLILWDYYLIYSIILGVNKKLDDKLIEKYVKNI